MDLGLRDRVVAVTGGTRGIGRAVVDALLAEGARVAVCARGAAGLTELIRAHDPDRVLLAQGDVRDEEFVGRWVSGIVDRFGRLDGLVANAGAGTTGGVLETGFEDFADQYAGRVGPILTLVRRALPELRSSDAGRVVIVNAISAHRPDASMAAVSLARASVASLVSLLAEDLAETDIRVNAVNLGMIATDRQRERHVTSGSDLAYADWLREQALTRGIPVGRPGTPDEVAPWVLMFLAPLAAYTTGTAIDVSGGLGARP